MVENYLFGEPEASSSIREYLAVSGDFLVITAGKGVLLASSGQGCCVMLYSARMGQPAGKPYLVQMVVLGSRNPALNKNRVVFLRAV